MSRARRACCRAALIAAATSLPSALALEAQAVSFPAADGVRLYADYYPPPIARHGAAPMVILLHMYRSDRRAWEPLVAPLHEVGFAVLALDLRGHGESATTETRQAVLERDRELFRKMQNDVRGAYDWLAAQAGIDRARFALVGASVGCSVALQYAAGDRSVDAIVGLSPGLDYLGLDSAGDIGQITGRKVLLLATEDERDAPYTLAQRGHGVSVRILAGHTAHGTDMLSTIPNLEKDIAGFLREAVGQPSFDIVYGSIRSSIYHAPDSEYVRKISATNLRFYSSPQEAEARGLRPARSRGEARLPARR